MNKPFSALILFLTAYLPLIGQNDNWQQTVKSYFRTYTLPGYRPADRPGVDSLRADNAGHIVAVYANESFTSQPFTPQSVRRIYAAVQRALPAPYNTYHIAIYAKGGTIMIEDLIPNILREQGKADDTRLWGKIDYTGRPWVRNASLPYRPTQGLQGRHLFLWASHGRYYKRGSWQWQRPYLYATTEDLFTQSFVYPYLFPMLERAGAVVGTPRERDYQTAEAVIDNDTPSRQGTYDERNAADVRWRTSPLGEGFAMSAPLLCDSLHPFTSGTYRRIKAVRRRNDLATATWTPTLPREGRYAVYVSYASDRANVPDARYTVYHKGERTVFEVNQQMGGGTWVYLGTFEFDTDNPNNNRIVLSNHSDFEGYVTADAVRLGGGVGQDERGTAGTSGLPRFLEAARYYAQWAGVPDSLVNTTEGTDDYADDLRVRGNMVNWLASGSPYLPDGRGGGSVPFELSLALHSDAGVRSDRSIFGSLAISTTHDASGSAYYPAGLSRLASNDLASLLLQNITTDLSRTYGINWTRREQWDRNYAETRIPSVPSAILEMLSHQNYDDMRWGHDPNFKFTLARSVYKTLLHYSAFEHGLKSVTVQPLPPQRPAAVLSDDHSQVTLSWQPQTDPLEPSAQPTGYVVYTRINDGDFDNGFATGNITRYVQTLRKGVRYAFKVTAINAGGESFPSETVTAYNGGASTPVVLIVNGFDRVSGPARVDRGDSLGFDLDADPGVPYLVSAAFAGRQTDFTTRAPEHNTSGEYVGSFLPGNRFDDCLIHGRAIAAAGGWSYCSVSRDAFTADVTPTRRYRIIDYILGLQANRSYNLKSYKTFPDAVRTRLQSFTRNGGNLLVSGSFVGSDNADGGEATAFLRNCLKVRPDGTAMGDPSETLTGLGTHFSILRRPFVSNPDAHYAAPAPDAILPVASRAFSAFAYGGGQGAGVAYEGDDYRAVTMGFPFECIKDANVRTRTMGALLRFLSR